MCELLGFSFDKPINPNYYLEKFFFDRSKYNPDGWGVAYYRNKAVQVIKEPIRADESNLGKQLIENSTINSKLILSHIRKLSVGIKNLKNTHPFHRELNGREFVFTHNGTIFNYKKYQTGQFTPIGNTDSEHMFCNLLYQIKKGETRSLEEPWDEPTFLWFNGYFNMINRNNKVNCMFSDGRFLFCYKDQKNDNSLCFLKKKYPFEASDNQELDSETEGYIIASKKLTDEPWEEIDQGELLVFKNGTLIFRLHQ